jgi:hypothetical protein
VHRNSNVAKSGAAALRRDSVILDDQDDHLVLTLRVPKELIRENFCMLGALSDVCVTEAGSQ